MKKKYFVEYWTRFSNTYNLYWADETNVGDVPTNAERISRKEALRLARAESDRRGTDQAFSGFSDVCIYPVDYSSGTGVPGVLLDPDPVEPLILLWRTPEKQAQVRAAVAAGDEIPLF